MFTDFFLDPEAHAGLADQIYDQIRSGIMSGRLHSGDFLPPSRELAESLGVSRSTVTTAYGRLVAEGFLEGNRGGGTMVSELFGQDLSTPTSTQVFPVDRDLIEAPKPTFDFRPGSPDPSLFPVTEWKRYAKWAVDQHRAEYGDPAGLADLRLVLARWITRSRGVDAGFRQLVVTSGAQQALYLLARVCAGPGDVVAIEDPGYTPFRRIVDSVGGRTVPVPVDEEGIVVDRIPKDARLVYVTPSHQFPTGVTMSMGRRLALLALAQKRGMIIVEDDYDSEYRYVDRPLEPLARLDQAGLVAYVMSFSKVLSPGLRLGFMIVPPLLLPEVVELRRRVDWTPSTIDQLTLRGFVADGLLDRHLRSTRRVYEARHQKISQFLATMADQGVVAPPVSNAGLHVSVRLPAGDEADVLERLAERGAAVGGFGSYAVDLEAGGGLVFGIGAVNQGQIEAALPLVEGALLR